MQVKHLLTSSFVTCQKNHNFLQVHKLLAEHGFSVVPVVDENGVVEGIISMEVFRKTCPG